MSAMDAFFSLLSSNDQITDPYLKQLVFIVSIDLDTLRKIVDGLGWQQWGAQATTETNLL